MKHMLIATLLSVNTYVCDFNNEIRTYVIDNGGVIHKEKELNGSVIVNRSSLTHFSIGLGTDWTQKVTMHHSRGVYKVTDRHNMTTTSGEY